MKIDELKIRISHFLNGLIDTYYGEPNITEKMVNYTMKIIVKNNIDKVDSLLKLFSDENGNIDAESIVNDYVIQMGDEKVTFNLKDYIESPIVSAMLPDKSLAISAKDIKKILSDY